MYGLYFMHNAENRHFGIRINTVNKITNVWEYYKEFVVDPSLFNTVEDYKNLLSRGGENGGSVEFLFIRRLCSNNLLTMHYKSSIIPLIMELEALFAICCFQIIMIQAFRFIKSNPHTFKSRNVPSNFDSHYLVLYKLRISCKLKLMLALKYSLIEFLKKKWHSL